MSDTGKQAGARAPGAGSEAPDPSMEDILASIRRILSEDEAPAPAAGAQPVVAQPVSFQPAPAAHPPATEAGAENGEVEDEADVFDLDTSMMVEEPASRALSMPTLPMPPPPAPPQPAAEAADLPSLYAARAPEPTEALPVALSSVAAPLPPVIPMPGPENDDLVAPEAAAATASAMSNLRRTLESGRAAVAVSRGGGPTLEDMVREELRPVLKAWLDHNLPPLVERLVRAEIERVVGRAAL